MSDERERVLSFSERAKWGECPACGAKDGVWCDPNQGIRIGGARLGAHLGRLQRAPFKVREVAA